MGLGHRLVAKRLAAVRHAAGQPFTHEGVEDLVDGFLADVALLAPQRLVQLDRGWVVLRCPQQAEQGDPLPRRTQAMTRQLFGELRRVTNTFHSPREAHSRRTVNVEPDHRHYAGRRSRKWRNALPASCGCETKK